MNQVGKDAILRELRELAAGPRFSSSYDNELALMHARRWKGLVLGATSTALGEGHAIVREIRLTSIGHTGEALTARVTGPYTFRLEGDEEIKGLLERAVREVQRAGVSPDVLLVPAEDQFDYELWPHVRGLVELAEWNKLPGVVSTFVEGCVRRWADYDRTQYGAVMFAQAFNPKVPGPLVLGATPSEREGWRDLAVGMAKGIGGEVRHGVPERADLLKSYAVGCLGLGSLLLTQVRYEHPDRVH